MLRTITLAAVAAITLASQSLAGDPVAGEQVFKKCATCHAVGPDAKNKVGPLLNGIVGRKMATVEGFKYSDVFVAKATEGVVWDEATIDAYLAKPADWLKGNKMSFAGLRKPEERADVIAYLAQFK